MSAEMGALAAALAKAQAAFPAVVKDKNVTIEKKSGGSYSFSYAPLDSILEATRKPLSDNGIAVVQMLDEGALITSIIHEGGGIISGRIDLPQTSDVKELGSAVTYLRRYAIQAALGIAAEDDDDGSGANGDGIELNTRPGAKAGETVEIPADGIIGEVAVKPEWLGDLLMRETTEGPVIGFRLKLGRQQLKVQARGPMALAVAGLGPDLAGQNVTCWGSMVGEEFTPKGTTRPVTYQVLRLSKMRGPDFEVPSGAPVDTVSTPMFSPAEDEEIALALGVTK